MTIPEVMDTIAAKIRAATDGQYYTAKESGGDPVPLAVYAGYPPARTAANAVPSFIYVLAAETRDTVEQSTASVEIGFNIFDNDAADGWRTLFNLIEHVRQALLAEQCIDGRNALVPSAGGELLKTEIVTEQPWPNWQAKMTATYTIDQPTDERLNEHRLLIDTF